MVPVEGRRVPGIEEGGNLIGELRNGGFVVTTKRARLAAAPALFQKYCLRAQGRLIGDELAAERLATAARQGGK